MRRLLPLLLVIAVLLASLPCGARDAARSTEEADRLQPIQDGAVRSERSSARGETLWIFHADFSDETGNNAGWLAYDRSDTAEETNYWHIDTLFQTGTPGLGDSAWWCGTYNGCWRQGRGYGNDWEQHLWRDFPLSGWSVPTDAVTLQFDHRYAMEHDYDRGYVDVSDDDGSSWETIASYTNPGLPGEPGTSVDWHTEVLGLSDYAGSDVRVRFRFESNDRNSSADQPDNPPQHSYKDGAWQLDNFEWRVNGTPVWSDDCESGDTGWVHDDVTSSGQTNVTFWRGQYNYEFFTGRYPGCDEPAAGTWMQVPVEPMFSTMVDHEDAWLLSPPIDIAGAATLVAQWHIWVDCPTETHDYYDLWLASHDIEECVRDLSAFRDEEEGKWNGGYYWTTETDRWDAFAGNDWLAMAWRAWNEEEPEPGAQHYGGLFLDWVRVGMIVDDPSTTWDCDPRNLFKDWFTHEAAQMALDEARVMVLDTDGVLEVSLLATGDGGMLWNRYPMTPESPGSDWWVANLPAGEAQPGAEVLYYFEAMDGVGNLSACPADAPEHLFEFTVLPTVGPDMLLVDDHGGRAQTQDGGWGLETEDYYEEIFQILGYEYDKYDVRDPLAEGSDSDGPDLTGLRNYETVVWFTNDLGTQTLKDSDQENIVGWLADSAMSLDRNLLLTGNDIAHEVVYEMYDPHALFGAWLAVDYFDDSLNDTEVQVCDAGLGFIDLEDGCCDLLAGCPQLPQFDVIEAGPGIPGAEDALDYVLGGGSDHPAGVSYVHPVYQYRAVTLGFGVEYMDVVSGARGTSGLAFRANLLGNILTHFETEPTGPGTGVVDGRLENALSEAYPNPLNPRATIEYSVRQAGPVSIRVYDVAGKLVRTLLETEGTPGRAGRVIWDGLDDRGDPCASGVYFYRIEAPGFASTKKMVLLK